MGVNWVSLGVNRIIHKTNVSVFVFNIPCMHATQVTDYFVCVC